MKFEDLEVLQCARKLVNEIYVLMREPALAKDFGLRDQIQRAAVSVMTNVAEGFERTGGSEKLHFYNIARASCGEVRSLLYVAEDNYPTTAETSTALRTHAIAVGKLLSGLIASTHRRQIGKAVGIILTILVPVALLVSRR
jgi:four helix bundle protein